MTRNPAVTTEPRVPHIPGFPVVRREINRLHAAFLTESRTRRHWLCCLQEFRVSRVFREMWGSTALPPKLSTRLQKAGASLVPALFVAGCSRAPSFNILGSFFPAWILCGLLGILLTVAARLFLVRIKFEQELSPLILVYPCLTAFFTFTLWLVFFS
jgi:hypothetical protein